MSKRILVTGGAGFLGSHLCDKLLSEGNQVIAVDNFYTGKKNNIKHHFDNTNYEYIRHDVVNPIFLEVDQVYHLACPASPIHYQTNPIKTVKTNVLGTLNILGLAKRVNARFLLASTSEIYGDPLEHPQVESYLGNVNTVGPRSCYDEGKRVAETLTYNYNISHDVDTKMIRIFNTYGPRMLFNDGRVVSNFIYQALTGKDLTIFGDGEQTRSFCFVSDLVEGICKMMNSEDFKGPVNLGNPGEFTIKELAELVLEVTGSSSKIVKLEALQDDPKKRKPDISLAKKELDWEPKIALKEGLLNTIKDFEKRIAAGETNE